MIIGIAGNINSGKDTVASMLNYIMSVGKHKAKFSDWRIKQLAYDNSFSYKITHFADILKLNLSNIFNINVDVFNNRKFKDECWFYPYTGEFIIKIEDISNYKQISLENSSEFNINNPKQIIKIRTLMQIYAEFCKKLFGEHVWIKGTIDKAKLINSIHKYCLIPDVRFKEESYAIARENGIVVRIERPENNEYRSDHISENDRPIYNYIIENDGNLSNLFYKVLAFYEKIKME